MINKYLHAPQFIMNFLDDLSDGQWHSRQKIAKRNKDFVKDKTFYDSTVRDMEREGVLIPGTNSAYRMSRSSLEQWRTQRGIPNDPTNYSTPRIFGGELEDDMWAKTPLKTHDIVHFQASPKGFEQAIELTVTEGVVISDSGSLVQVHALDGTRIYSKLKEFSHSSPTAEIRGVRITQNSRRRHISSIPPQFLNEFVEYYGVLTHTFLRPYYNVLKRYLVDRDELQQQVYLWVIQAIQRYDESTSIPFAAYLHSVLGRWVHDLSRKAYGRTMSDSELQIARARAEFQQKHHRLPSQSELAETMGDTEERLVKKLTNLDNIASLKNSIDIHDHDWAHNTSTHTHETPETIYTKNSENMLLSLAIINACKEHSNIKTFVDIYQNTWGTSKKTKPPKIPSDIAKNIQELLLKG